MLTNLRNTFPTVPWGLRDVVLGMLLVAGGGLLLARLLAGLASDTESSRGLAFSIVLVVVEGLMLLAVVVFAIAKHHSTWQELGVRSVEAVRGVYVVTALVILASLSSHIIYFAIVTSAGWTSLAPPEVPKQALGEGGLRVLNVLTIGLWGPFTEELFFRGFALPPVASRFGVLAALVGTSALFALSHGTVSLMIPVFTSGLLLAWLYIRTGSIWPCVAAHSAQNILAIMVVAQR